MSAWSITELRQWIGRQATYVAPEEVGPAAIRYFALALGDDNPLYQDSAAASATRFGGIMAPPTFVCETNQFYPSKPDQDGYIGHIWPLPVSNPALIRGGNEYQFLEPVRPTDRVTVTWTITDINEKTTRNRGLCLFVVSEARYTNQHGVLLAINRETIIYKP